MFSGCFRKTAAKGLSVADCPVNRSKYPLFFRSAAGPLFCRFKNPEKQSIREKMHLKTIFCGRGHWFLWNRRPGSGTGGSGADSGPDLLRESQVPIGSFLRTNKDSFLNESDAGSGYPVLKSG